VADPLNFAVIPTNGRACFKDCLLAIEPQVDEVIVVEGGPEAARVPWVEHPVIREPELNISKWWNLGLEMAQLLAKGAGAPQWNVAILNDDTIVPTGWMSAVTAAMRQESAAAACSGDPPPYTRVSTRAPRSNKNRSISVCPSIDAV